MYKRQSLEGADALATGTVVKLSVISEKAENVMTVPVDCVSYSGGQAYVYIYDQEAGAARKVAIEDGLIGSERIQVLSGLDYSDQVITTWTKELYEGAPSSRWLSPGRCNPGPKAPGSVLSLSLIHIYPGSHGLL